MIPGRAVRKSDKSSFYPSKHTSISFVESILLQAYMWWYEKVSNTAKDRLNWKKSVLKDCNTRIEDLFW